MTAIVPLPTLAAWQALEAHYPKVRELNFPWGGELGKALAARIIYERETGAKCQLKHGNSTNTLIRRYRRSKELLYEQ